MVGIGALVAALAVAAVVVVVFVLNPAEETASNSRASSSATASATSAAVSSAASKAATSTSGSASADSAMVPMPEPSAQAITPAEDGAKNSNSESSASSTASSKQPTTSAGTGSPTVLNSEYSIRANLPTGYTLTEYYDGNAVWSSSKGDMVITASGTPNSQHATLKEYREQRMKEYRNIGYSPTGDDWFVLSGENNGETYYVKCYVGPNYIKTISFSYTSGESGDDIVEQVYPTISVGSL